MIWTESLFEQLIKQGWAYDDKALDMATAQKWRDLLENKRAQQKFRSAQLAKNHLSLDIRSDQISWLDPTTPEDVPILNALDHFRNQAQESLLMSMPKTEAHFAVYPSGSFYKRHCDQPKGKQARVLTFVIYLHSQWEPGFGGELAIHDGDTDRVLHVIEPLPRRVVIFKSDEVWHEVQKSSFDRFSLTGWFRHELHSFSSSEKNTF